MKLFNRKKEVNKEVNKENWKILYDRKVKFDRKVKYDHYDWGNEANLYKYVNKDTGEIEKFLVEKPSIISNEYKYYFPVKFFKNVTLCYNPSKEEDICVITSKGNVIFVPDEFDISCFDYISEAQDGSLFHSAWKYSYAEEGNVILLDGKKCDAQTLFDHLKYNLTAFTLKDEEKKYMIDKIIDLNIKNKTREEAYEILMNFSRVYYAVHAFERFIHEINDQVKCENDQYDDCILLCELQKEKEEIFEDLEENLEWGHCR